MLTTGLKSYAADAARVEGRFTMRAVRTELSSADGAVHESGDGRYSNLHSRWIWDDGDVQNRKNQIRIRNRKTGRIMQTIEVPSTRYPAFRGGAGYALFYERRGELAEPALLTSGEDTEGLDPMLYRTHTRMARFRAGYPKTPPPKRGGFEFVTKIPQLRNVFSMWFRVDRQGQDDAEAILYAIHPGLVRICYLEDEMRIERYRIDPELHAEVLSPQNQC